MCLPILTGRYLHNLRLDWFASSMTGHTEVQRASTSLYVDPSLLHEVSQKLSRQHQDHHGQPHEDPWPLPSPLLPPSLVQSGHFYTDVGQKVDFRVSAMMPARPSLPPPPGVHGSNAKVKVDVQFTHKPPLALECL